MPFDRRYVIVDGEATRAGRTLTARIVPNLLAYRAWADDRRVYAGARDGSRHEPNAALAALVSQSLHRQVTIEAAPDGEPAHDAHDLLVLSGPSLRALEAEWGKPLDPLRFRPNIILDGDDIAPYVENSWIGKRFRAGDAIIEGVALDQRCVLTTIDPRTLEIDPSLLRLVVERHDKCFGLYCRVAQAGNIAVGDEWTAR